MTTTLLPQEQLALISEYKQGVSAKKLAEKYDMRTNAVHKLLKRRGIPAQNPNMGKIVGPPLTETQRKMICQEYLGGKSAIVLAYKYGRHPTSIYELLRNRGVVIRELCDARRVFSLNESAFDEPLTERGRYFVGLLMADGCIRERKMGANTVKLQLSREDRFMVQKFRDFLGSNQPLRDEPAHRRPGKNYSHSFELTVSSKKLTDALARYGVLPRKSFTAKVIGLESDRDFWRGYIDGDGALMIDNRSKNPYGVLDITGSQTMMRQFSAFVRKISPGCTANVGKNGTIFKCLLSGYHAQAVLHHLYNHCEIALPRKLAMAEAIFALPVPKKRRAPTDPRGPGDRQSGCRSGC